MTEYVTKEQVKEEILSWARCINNPDRLVTEDTLYIIDALPPADVQPVIRGRWINEERVGFGSVEAECSNCGRRMIYNPAWICCPWCMADMRDGDAE